MKDKNLYYLQDSRTYTGNCMMWWRENGAGYTSDITEAWALSYKRAMSYHKARHTDIPWPVDYIKKKARPRVDFQYVDDSAALKEGK